MKLLIIGIGTVGFATLEGFKRMGHDVYFFDIDIIKKGELKTKGYQIYDKDAYVNMVFVCVEEWNVEEVFETWHDTFRKYAEIVVIRSTVPPGTTKRLSDKYNLKIVHNPEFLRERDALRDFLYPDKIVIGHKFVLGSFEDTRLKQLYTPFNVPLIFTDSTTSEFLKLASNAVLFSYISIWNQLKPIADKIGVNSHQVAKILTLDPRISKYGTIHGTKVGGFCLPKDLDSMIKLGSELNITTILLDAVKAINDELTGDKVEEDSSTKKAREEV